LIWTSRTVGNREKDDSLQHLHDKLQALQARTQQQEDEARGADERIRMLVAGEKELADKTREQVRLIFHALVLKISDESTLGTRAATHDGEFEQCTRRVRKASTQSPGIGRTNTK
jgi:hypothetical protein